MFIGPKIVRDGLELALDAGSPISYPKSGTTWIDLSSRKNDFSITGATWNSAGYFTFSGTANYMSNASFSTSIGSGQVVTTVAWIRPNSGQGDTSYNGIFSYGARSCDGTSLLMSMNNSYGPTMAKWCNDFTSPTSNMDTTSWWQYVLTINSTTVTFYLNGVSAGSGTITGASFSTGTAAIGSTDVYGRLWKGDMVSLSLYNRVLTTSEISQNYETMKGRFGK